MASIIYHSPILYQAAMRLLHGRHFASRYTKIAAHIPAGSSVVELCAGDAYLYRNYLREKEVRFVGLDNSPQFVAAAQAQGIDMRFCDVATEPIPSADIVLMQASLFYFSEQAPVLISRMLRAASGKVIISEPVKNLASSSNRVLRFIARILTKPHGGEGQGQFRYREDTFRAEGSAFPELASLEYEDGRREMIAVFHPQPR